MEEQSNINNSTMAGSCESSSNNNNNNNKGDQQPISGSTSTTGSNPSSPFELRRHRSFYDSTTTTTSNQQQQQQNTNNSGGGGGSMITKRRASAKASSVSVKTKSSNQILNFFRSQSHEPKNSLNNNNNNLEDAPLGPPLEAGEGGNNVEVAPVAKPRKQRPTSLYTKTTTSKGVFLHRTSGIGITPETPEVFSGDLIGGSGGEDVVSPSAVDINVHIATTGNVMTTSTSSHSSGGGGNEEQLPGHSSHHPHPGGGGHGGDNSSSRSSVSSSDSFASCGVGGSSLADRRGGDGLEEEESLDNFEGAMDGLKKDNRQSLKHLSVSAPAMRTASTKSASGGDGSDSGLPPMTTSKSRQKKFHRHFKNVPQDEKVLDYYSCALVGDILLQGFLYITENYFAFYSNVFGYVTKVLIPVCTVVRITKERTAKIFPNAVGVSTRTEKHVFASLISRDTTFKLMCKVWNYSIEQEAEEIRQLQRRVAAQVEAEDGFSADVPVPDESSGDSGSGNDSAIEPSSHSPSPQNTPGIEKLVHAKTVVPSHLVAVGGATTIATAAGAQAGVVVGEDKSVTLISGGAKINADDVGIPSSTVPNILNYRGTTHQFRSSIPTAANTTTTAHLSHGTAQRQSQPQQQDSSQFRQLLRSLGSSFGGRGPSLLLVATTLLVILFVSAALLLSRISSLQQRLLERPVIHDSEQFYQELLSWQTKLHSTTGDEIHQYINSNLQQIVKVRESLEALSMLFVNRPHQGAPGLGEAHSGSIITGGDHHHHHKDS